MQLIPSFLELLQEFRPVFTSPTFLTFITLVRGWCFSWRHRYVIELIQARAAPPPDTTAVTTVSSVKRPGRSTACGTSWPACSSISSPLPA